MGYKHINFFNLLVLMMLEHPTVGMTIILAEPRLAVGENNDDSVTCLAEIGYK